MVCEDTEKRSTKMRRTTKAGSSLVGALIGLVRATDGASHVTDDTYNIIIEGLHISDMALNVEESEINAMTGRAHADKHSLVPDCSVCTAPCGRTDDYDWESVYRENHAESPANDKDKTEQPVVAEQSIIPDVRIAILSRLQNIAHRVISGEINADDDVNFIICRAVFALGEGWSAGELGSVERELQV